MRLPFRRRRAEPAAPDVAASLWHRLAAGDETVWNDLAALDAVAAAGSPEQRTAFGIGVLETLQNLLSHPGSGVDAAAVRARLGRALGRLWDELDAHWVRVADWVDETGASPTAVSRDDVHAVADPELRTMVRALHRTLPDGRFVALSDAARRELVTGETFRAS